MVLFYSYQARKIEGFHLMKQIILPLIPSGATSLSDILSVETVNDVMVYYQGAFPIFTHPKDDKRSHYMFIGHLIAEGRCKFTVVQKALGIPKTSLHRIVNKYKAKGIAAFYEERKTRKGGIILTKDIKQKVQTMLNNGMSVSDVAEHLEIKYDTIQKAIQDGRLYKGQNQPVSEINSVSTKSSRTVDDSQPELGTACTRITDRICSSLLKMGTAETKFESCSDVTFGGVLSALPALQANGLLRYLDDCFRLPEGYYGIEHIVLTLAYMALCRIKSPEQLRHQSPGELGKLIGLDRIPEVKTIRDKLTILTEDHENVAQWSLKLSQDWMHDFPDLTGVLYIDGHSKLYSGKLAELPRKYFTRLRLCMRGTNVYYVNDILGQPFFSIEKTIDPGMIEVLRQNIIPRLLRDIPNQPSVEELKTDPYLHRFILVFDREGYSPKLFRELWEEHRIACITYHKYPKDKWKDIEFENRSVNMPDGEVIEMKLAERGALIGSAKKEQIWVREIRKQNKSGHQTSIIATGYKLNLMLIAAFMFTRWVQENFFKYMIYHYNIDRLIEYGTVPVSGLEKIINPAWRKLDSKIRSLNSKINVNNAKFGKIELRPEGNPELLNLQIKTKAEIVEEVERLQKELETLKLERKTIDKHIDFENLPPKDKFEKLKPNGKMFIDTIKLLAYRAETAMTSLIKEFLSRNDDARPIIRDILTSEADLIPVQKEEKLIVQIHRMASPKIDDAVKQFLEELNKMEILYPGTKIKLVYRLAGN